MNYPSIAKFENIWGRYTQDHDINFKTQISYDLDKITEKILEEN